MKRIFSFVLACFTVILFTCAAPLTAQAAMDGSPTGDIVTTWTGTPGDLYRYHTHTKGVGIPIIIMPVHFGSGDLGVGGRLQTASKWAADIILDSEQYLFDGFADYLDVYVYIQSESVSPVPTQGYVNSFQDKFYIMHDLAQNTIGKTGHSMDIGLKVRMVYLGNSDNAGQVGGHAYTNIGALLSWGNAPDTGIAHEPNPSYWALHEFWGHSFAGLADEYIDVNDSGSGTVAPNLYVSSGTPSNASVPWRDFIGYQENNQTFGVYRYGSTNRFHPTTDSFMKTNPSYYVPMYHKWAIYQKVMEYAETPKTLEDFCALMGITLPGDTSGDGEDFGPNPSTGIFDVKEAVLIMNTFLILSAVLWGYIFVKRRSSNG